MSLSFHTRAHKISHTQSLTWSLSSGVEGFTTRWICFNLLRAGLPQSTDRIRIVGLKPTLTYLGLVQHSSVRSPSQLGNKFFTVVFGPDKGGADTARANGLIYW